MQVVAGWLIITLSDLTLRVESGLGMSCVLDFLEIFRTALVLGHRRDEKGQGRKERHQGGAAVFGSCRRWQNLRDMGPLTLQRPLKWRPETCSKAGMSWARFCQCISVLGADFSLHWQFLSSPVLGLSIRSLDDKHTFRLGAKVIAFLGAVPHFTCAMQVNLD